MRILVTGSRDWTNQTMIVTELWDAVRELGGDDFVLVHGACPTGADHIADMVWSTNQWPVERHPADWEQFGRAAGPLRNKEMVDLGADVCLAFIGPCTSPRCNIEGTHPSHGASGCADLAEEAGIPTKRFTA